MNRKLTLIRGLPGSAKSTLAQIIVNKNPLTTIRFEADFFFMKDGVYTFKGEDLWRAHAMCQNQARYHLSNEKDVVVANTFTTLEEMQPYLDMKYDSIEIIKCINSFGSVHDVNEDVIQRMRDRWEDVVGETINEFPVRS